MFWLTDWVCYAYLMSDGTGHVTCSTHLKSLSVRQNRVGHLQAPDLIIKGWDGQFQRTVYWHCEYDKLLPAARFQLLAVCRSWTRGHKASEPCLARLQLANVEVLINDGSHWKTFIALLKPGQRLIKKIKFVWGRSFPLKGKSFFPGCNTVRFLLVGCLLEVTDKKELPGLFIDFFGQTFHLS